MKKRILTLALFGLLLGPLSASATYVYVGQWHVGDGPVWTDNPDVLSGIEVAALLFGGDASDYAISTISDQVSDINFLTFLDGWADTQYLFNPQAQDWKLDSGDPGYNDPSGLGTAYSAYVLDHTCQDRYSDMTLTCAELSNPIGGTYINYAFREVPEPGTLALLGIGLFGMGLAKRKRV